MLNYIYIYCQVFIQTTTVFSTEYSLSTNILNVSLLYSCVIDLSLLNFQQVHFKSIYDKVSFLDVIHYLFHFTTFDVSLWLVNLYSFSYHSKNGCRIVRMFHKAIGSNIYKFRSRQLSNLLTSTVHLLLLTNSESRKV